VATSADFHRPIDMLPLRTIVFGEPGGESFLADRTIRALGRQDIAADDVTVQEPTALAGILLKSSLPVWLLRAGAWPARDAPMSALPRSSTGIPLCALGATLEGPGETGSEGASQWQESLAATGGHFEAPHGGLASLPPIDSVYLEPPVVAALAARSAAGEPLKEALRDELAAPRRRLVRVAALDVHHDRRLRVLQVITSLQRGGAERIAINLHHALQEHGCRSRLVTLGRPTRSAFPAPPGTIDLSRRGPERAARIASMLPLLDSFAADLVHAHLLRGSETKQLATAGLPTIVTIHNTRAGWPEGLETLTADDATLLVACANAVEMELRMSGIPVPTRTVWNGIDVAPLRPTPELRQSAGEFRQRLHIAEADFVLLALANPRPQKRMEMLPAVLAATRTELCRRGVRRQARLLIGGEPSRIDPVAREAEAALRAAVAEYGVTEHVHFLGAVGDVPRLLAAADVLVSTSRHEGLSLAYLEALVADRPVVATDVGGTPEIAAGNSLVKLLPVDAAPHDYAVILADLANVSAGDGGAAAELNFSRPRMAASYRRLFASATRAHRKSTPRSGLWLVSNNFSTGGAQSSAARLLRGLHAEGVPVRAAVVQEQAAWPTPGRQRLEAAGIPVLALPPAGTVDPAVAVAELLDRTAADKPHAVVLWNVIPQYKVLLADGLLDVPLFDVSPGEMNFTSLQSYFDRPRPGLPYRTPQQYGARLAGAIVKYQAEAALAAEQFGVPVHVIPNGVPLDPTPALHRPRQPLILGTAARISPQKKLEDILLALRIAAERLPPYMLRIAGGPEHGAEGYAENLRELAEGLNVEWLGDLADPRPFYRDLDLFVMISAPAGCPNASLEAMAAGLPVVATDLGGASEQIVDGVTGRLVPPGDAEALAAAILACACDSDLRARYGASARDQIATHFDVGRMIQDYRRVLGI
jgi:glycosyltransferase involved in cell wall biosynthesis